MTRSGPHPRHRLSAKSLQIVDASVSFRLPYIILHLLSSAGIPFYLFSVQVVECICCGFPLRGTHSLTHSLISINFCNLTAIDMGGGWSEARPGPARLAIVQICHFSQRETRKMSFPATIEGKWYFD